MRWIVATFVVWLIATKRWDKWYALATTSAPTVQPDKPASSSDNKTEMTPFGFPTLKWQWW